MVEVSPASQQGKRVHMSKKSPQARDGKKVAQMSLKEKRQAKRAKQEPEPLIKARKGATA